VIQNRRNFSATSGAYNTSGSASDYSDVFVSKLRGDLNNLIASTFIDGSDNEYAYSIVLDSDGNVYLAGETVSPDFPVTSDAYDASFAGYASPSFCSGSYNTHGGDAFVTKLDSNLGSLIVSTFLGGDGNDLARSLAINTSGNIYVAGFTCSSDFPTTSRAYDTTGYTDDNHDTFVSKLDSDLDSLIASTFLGEDDYDKQGFLCI